MKCPKCGFCIGDEAPLFVEAAAAAVGRRGGQVKSSAKSAAARANGSKGGRPRKNPSLSE